MQSISLADLGMFSEAFMIAPGLACLAIVHQAKNET